MADETELLVEFCEEVGEAAATEEFLVDEIEVQVLTAD